MTLSTFLRAITPSGNQENIPAAIGRIYPALTRSLWLATEASDGSSLRVRRKRDDIFNIALSLANYFTFTVGSPDATPAASISSARRIASSIKVSTICASGTVFITSPLTNI